MSLKTYNDYIKKTSAELTEEARGGSRTQLQAHVNALKEAQSSLATELAAAEKRLAEYDSRGTSAAAANGSI